MNSNGTDVMVCNLLLTFFNCHSIRATKQQHSCRAGLFLTTRTIKISMHRCQEARDFKNHHRLSGLPAFNVSSSVLTTAEHKTAHAFLPNVRFHKAAAKPVVGTAL